MASNSKTRLSDDQVKHIGYLARLHLSNKDIKKFQQQLVSILHFVNRLNEVDTTNVSPTSQVTGLKNVFRDDVVRPSLSQAEVLANAPDSYKGYFKVKPVKELNHPISQ